jgi:hypothetical protein
MESPKLGGLSPLACGYRTSIGSNADQVAHLRSHGKKLDLILETLGRQGERLSRVERDVGEARRNISEIKSDKFLSTQTEILSILYRLDQTTTPMTDDEDHAATPPTPSGSSKS